MTSPTAESIASARLDERFRIAEFAEERAQEIEAVSRARHEWPGGPAEFEARALREFAAELRRL